MARTRLELHEELCEVLGSRNCYYSPPANLVMKYPCIRYEEENPSIDYADNLRYRYTRCWMITIIDEDPDSILPLRLMQHFPYYCSRERSYPSDGLNHFVYLLYY